MGLSEPGGLTKGSRKTATPFETHPNKTVSHRTANTVSSAHVCREMKKSEGGLEHPLETC